MKKTATKLTKSLSIVLSLLMILSVINMPGLKAKAAGTVDDFVERCYTVTLDRGSDPDGFADWKGQLLNGKAVGIEIAYGFLFSPEYTRKNKDNDAYLKDLYMLFMGREPDEGGYNDWMGKLNNGASRLEVFAGFANSQEFYNICDSYGVTAGRYVMGYDRPTINNVNLFVERMYKITLGRIGDKGGQNNWVEKLISKQISGSECARSFIFSQEYINQELSDAEFVENLYLAMFGRSSDADGKNNWLYGLKNGMTRDEVFAGFANSVEFDNICKTYGINRGTYTATNKGTFDKDNPNNEQVKFNSFASAEVGDIIKFGKYEQDNDTSNGKEDIEWKVLSKENGKILVITEYCLDRQTYNTTDEKVTWETCSLRKWLNDDFFNEAFSEEEKDLIKTVTLENKDNPFYEVDGGKDTEDKVFILGLDELEQYFGAFDDYDSVFMSGTNKKIRCKPTAYAIFNEVGYYHGEDGMFAHWWLRTPGGYDNSRACFVFGDGGVGATQFDRVNYEYYGVRPALYLKY